MTTDSALSGRLPAIDLIKVLASQAIVWHHLVRYGPMARGARPLAETPIGWLAEDGRAAVYAFLVIGGYLAAGALLPQPGRPAAIGGLTGWLRLAARRYWRLAPPYLVAVAAAVVVAAFARWAMNDPDTAMAPTGGQLLAHALLIHDLLGYQALSAGVWYVAIDLQLYLLLAAIAWLAAGVGRWSSAAARGRGIRIGIGRGNGRGGGNREDSGASGSSGSSGSSGDRRAGLVAIASILALTLTSWAFCNRQEALDVYAPFFFGAYGLGVLARWSREARPPADGDGLQGGLMHPARCEWLAVLMAVCAIALLADPDRREVIAVAAALLLALAPPWSSPSSVQSNRPSSPTTSVMSGSARPSMLEALGRRSYSMFLIHYPVLLLTNALFAQFSAATGAATPLWAGLGLVATWLAAMLAAEGLYRWVEVPATGRGVAAWLLAATRRESPSERFAPK